MGTAAYRGAQIASMESMGKSLMNTILASIKDPVSVISRDYTIQWCNHFVARGRPVNMAEYEGRPCYEAFRGQTSPCQDDCPIAEVLWTGASCVRERWIPMKNGGQYWGEVRAYPVFDARGRVVGVVKIGYDITDRKFKANDRERYVERLEQALMTLSGDPAQEPVSGLTARELEVLGLLAEGCTNREIARVLGISGHTVKSHVVHIFNKLGVTDRTRAAVEATRQGII